MERFQERVLGRKRDEVAARGGLRNGKLHVFLLRLEKVRVT